MTSDTSEEEEEEGPEPLTSAQLPSRPKSETIAQEPRGEREGPSASSPDSDSFSSQSR